MDVLPAEMPSSAAMLGFPPAAEALVVPTVTTVATENEATNNIPTIVTTPSCSMVDNVALPPSSKSVIENQPLAAQETIVTHLGKDFFRQITTIYYILLTFHEFFISCFI